MATPKTQVIVLIVVAQFCCTSLWFAANGVAEGISNSFGLEDVIGQVTASVQFGFIIGTLVFAIFSVADRFSPSIVFMICGILGSSSNALITHVNSAEWLLILRFLTGFFLAGIYPVGMKIASDYHQKGLGLALGYLVGALVVGTALPHLLSDLFARYSWETVILISSCLAVLGAVLIGVGVPNGPYRKRNPKFDFTAVTKILKIKKLRGAAVGYFGHMWELYAFWAFVPVYLKLYSAVNRFPISNEIATFGIIAIGGLGCVIGGYLSKSIGSKRVASAALSLSLVCCLLSPFALALHWSIFLIFLIIWGVAVISDSPQFSNLVAGSSPPELVATSLTIVNSIGFGITILSISLLESIGTNKWMLLWLALGPILGLLYFRRNT